VQDFHAQVSEQADDGWRMSGFAQIR
jgi:hypothetical protein